MHQVDIAITITWHNEQSRWQVRHAKSAQRGSVYYCVCGK